MRTKILDRYIIKNFLIGYAISFSVLIGLRIIIELFTKLDEFTERADLGAGEVLTNIFKFYGLHSTLYFRDFAGMIAVVAAAFSLIKMVRYNELVAVMASGVSLKRVIRPIIILSLLLTCLLVIDQELLIPPLADKLVRGEDARPGLESYDVWFITDGKGSLIISRRFDVETSTLQNPTILTRAERTEQPGIWDVTGVISASRSVYNFETGKWDLINGRFTERGSPRRDQPVYFYESDITPRDIPVRRKSEHISLLSSQQLSMLLRQGTQRKDLAQLLSQKQFRITEPIINVIMVLVCLPILVCRDPKTMKSAVMISFAMAGMTMTANFVSKMLAAELFLNIRPELWAWMPIFIFTPVAFVTLDSMKT